MLLLRNLLRHRHLEEDLDKEVRSHLELLVEQNIANGMEEAAARRAARLELGSVDQVKDAVRDVRRGARLEQLWRDVKYGCRMLSRAKGWTAVIVASLALGIGANAALFSVINGLLLRKLPVRDPDTLVRFRHAGRNQMAQDVHVYGFTTPGAQGQPVEPTFSYPMYLQFLADNRTMSDLVACAPFGLLNVVVNGQADIATGYISSGNYYHVLGATTRLGRTITPDDDRPGAAPVAMISHSYWISRFGGSPNVVGMPVRVNNAPVTIVGVLAPEFIGVEQPVGDAPEVWLPLALEPQLNQHESRLAQATAWWLQVMGRLKPGITMAQVQGNLAGVFQATARTGFESYLLSLPQEERSRSSLQDRKQVSELQVDSGSHGIYDANTADVRAVTMLSAVVALVLLIVCANVANLVLSRSTGRQREVSVRLALGATPARLACQFLTESLLLAGLGGAFAMLVGRWGQQLLPGTMGTPAPLDWRVLAFVIVLTTATGVIFGMAPALRATRTEVNSALKETNRTVAGSRGFLGKSLLIVQVAISLVLLSGAGLFLRTVRNLRQVDLGFNPRNVLLFRVNPALNRYDTGKQNLLYEQVGERIRAIGGVRSVSWSNPTLLANALSTGIFFQGRLYARDQPDDIERIVVSPTFFETMEIPLVAGRSFTPRDRAGAPFVAVINEAAARKYFPKESPLGRRFGQRPEESGKLEIVGITRDTKYNNLRNPAVPTMYLPYLQAPQGNTTFEVRTAGDPLAAIAAVREAVRQVDPNLPLISVTTQQEEIERRFLQEQVLAKAYTLFGGLALLVAAVGLFGLMSYSVARRTNELGIRMALGAQREDVLRLVMGESMILVGVGVAIGLGGAIAASRLVASLLFGVPPTDPMTLAGAATVMVLVAALAGYLPARRASRIDLRVALHYE